MTEPSREIRNMQFLKIKADPSSHYDYPDDVVSDGRFEPAQKLEILRQWGRDLRKHDPDPAGAEDFASDPAVRRVARAIEELGADPDEILKSRSD